MSIFSSLRANFAKGLAQDKLAELLKPYEIKVLATSFWGVGKFSVTLLVPTFPDEDEEVAIYGEIGFSVDQPRVMLLDLNCDLRWLHLLADKHLSGRELPLTPEQVAQLRKLWP